MHQNINSNTLITYGDVDTADSLVVKVAGDYYTMDYDIFARYYNEVIVGNKTDHSANECDVFSEDMDETYFNAAPDYTTFKFLQGKNYPKLIVHILDQNFYFTSASGGRDVELRAFDIINDSLNAEAYYMLISNLCMTYNGGTVETLIRFTQSTTTSRLHCNVFNCRFFQSQTHQLVTHTINLVDIYAFIMNSCDFEISCHTDAIVNTNHSAVIKTISGQLSSITIINNNFNFIINDEGIAPITLYHDEGSGSMIPEIVIDSNTISYARESSDVVGTSPLCICYSKNNYSSAASITVKNLIVNFIGLTPGGFTYDTNFYLLWTGTSSSANTVYTFSDIELLFASNYNISKVLLVNKTTTTDIRIDINGVKLLNVTQDAVPGFVVSSGSYTKTTLSNIRYNANIVTDGNSTTKFISTNGNTHNFYALLTGTATGTMVIQNPTTGLMQYQTSCRKSKKNIRNIDTNSTLIDDVLLNMNIKEWDDISNGNPGVSFILEEFNESGLSDEIKNKVLFYDEEGAPVSYNTSNLLFMCIKKIKELNDRIGILESYHN